MPFGAKPLVGQLLVDKMPCADGNVDNLGGREPMFEPEENGADFSHGLWIGRGPTAAGTASPMRQVALTRRRMR